MYAPEKSAGVEMEASLLRQGAAGVEVLKLLSITELVTRHDDRGHVLKLARSDREGQIGEVYLSACLPGAVKAWHAHVEKRDRLCCVRGKVRLGLAVGVQAPEAAASLVLSADQPVLVTLKPGLWHGFQALGAEEAVLACMPEEPYHDDNPDEVRAPWDSVKGFWETRNR